MGEEPPLRIRFQRSFNLARMSLVSPGRDWLCRREPERGRENLRSAQPRLGRTPQTAFRDRAVAVGHMHKVPNGSILEG